MSAWVGLCLRRLLLRRGNGLAFVLAVLWLWRGPAIGILPFPLESAGVRTAFSLGPLLLLWGGLLSMRLCLAATTLRRKDSAWLCTAGVRPGQALAGLWLGSVLASGLVMVAFATLALAMLGDQAPRHAVTAIDALDGDRSLTAGAGWQSGALPLELRAGESIGIWTQVTAGGAPRAEVQLALLPGEPGPRRELFGRGLIQAEGPGTFERVALANWGPGQVGLLGGRGLWHLEPLTPAGFSLALFLRGFWVCALLASGALFAGIWLAPGLATALTLCLAVASHAFWPALWLHTGASLENLGHGIGPMPLVPWALAAGAGLIGLLAWAGARSLRSWGGSR
ncbi:MAG: hypothetical protein R3F33_17610 [Planctomycetota bacterium]